MTGKELKKKIQETGITVKDLANRLNMSPQALNTIFNVADVKSGTLEKIAGVLSVNMSFFYPMPAEIVNTSNIHSQRAHNISNGSGNINETTASSGEIVELLKQQNATLTQQVASLTELLKSLTVK